jgi:8-oxo-dGTP pyrophosphatase MutT (NUDIX family)
LVRAALSQYVATLESSTPEQKRAAVAMLLREHAGAVELLLIRRAVREGDPWSGQMALPGGRSEPQDTDALSTATRETLEEIGVDMREHARLLGRLDDTPAIARGRRIGMTISVFVFELVSEPAVQFSEEVAATAWVPLDELVGDTLVTHFHYELDGRSYALPAWNVRGDVVWGLTHRMITTLLRALDTMTPRDY